MDLFLPGERVRHTQQSSWHGRVHHTQEDDNPAFKLPDINKRGRSRSIADPKQIAQQNTRHLAWTTEKGKHNKAKPKNDGRSAHTNMTKKSLVKLSTPNIVVIAPGDSTSSMPSETVIKVVCINTFEAIIHYSSAYISMAKYIKH